MKPTEPHSLLVRAAEKSRSLFLLGIRLYIGYQSVVSGWAHLHNVPNMTAFFASLRIPFPEANVYVSGLAELVGGALLLIGLASRLTSLVLTIDFFVAMWTVELKNYGFSIKSLAAQVWSDQSPILGDTAFPFFATALIVLLFGPGRLSIDDVIRRRRAADDDDAGAA